MKSILIILVVLFFVITPVHGQLLSDATGLINRLDIQTSGYTFEIKLTSNFDLDDFIFDKDEKQLTLYIESGLENNLAEIIIPKDLLSGDFTFYLNDGEFFPKVQSNEIISFITLEFSGSGTHVVKIISTEYLNGSTETVPDVIEPSIEYESSSDDYSVWLIVGGIIIIILISVMLKILKNRT